MGAYNRISATAIKSLPPGKHGDGVGMRLNKRRASRNWVFRDTLARQRREKGLGSLREVRLKRARGQGERWRENSKE